MAKELHDNVLDAALDHIASNGTKVTVCGTEPTTYAEANATYMLANVTVDGADFTGPVNGDTSGRKITLNAQSGITPSSAGTGNWVTILDVTNTAMLVKTSCPAKAFDTGDTIDIAAFDVEIADPT